MFARLLVLVIVVNVGTLGAAYARNAPAGVTWTPISPIVTGGYSGKLNAFAYSKRNANVMYVAGGWGNTPRESPSQAGIYRTNDGGAHWIAIDKGLTNPDGTISSVVNGIWVDQKHPATVLAATEFGGTYRSTNSGNSWTNVDPNESTQFALVNHTLYLAARNGVLASTDDGATWSVSLPASAGATTVVTAGGATYAGLATGDVYALKDSAWTQVGHVGTGPVHDLAVDPFNAKLVYASVDDVKAWNQHLYGSKNGGHTWRRINCPCSIGAQAIAFSVSVPDRLYVADDGGGSIYYIAADGSPRTTFHRGAGTHFADVRYIYPVPGSGSSDACYVTTDQGLLYAADCNSGPSLVLSNAIPNFLAYDATLSPDAANIVIALQDWDAMSGPTGGSGQHGVVGSNEGGETTLDSFDSERCFFAHPDDGLYVSTDSCFSFGTPSVGPIASLTFAPGSSGSRAYAVTSDDSHHAAVAISKNAGQTFAPTGWAFNYPYQVAVSPVDANTILVATGTTAQKPRLFYTRDGGTTWRQSHGLPQNAPRNQAYIYFPTHRFYVAFEPNASGTVLLADHDPDTDNVLVYRSSDNGATFSLANTFVQPTPQRPWPNLIFPQAGERPARDTTYYATRFYGNRLAFNLQAPSSSIPAVVLTTRFGAFLSYDAGSTWSRADTTSIAHHFVGADWVGGYLYLASFGEGVIKSSGPLQ